MNPGHRARDALLHMAPEGANHSTICTGLVFTSVCIYPDFQHTLAAKQYIDLDMNTFCRCKNGTDRFKNNTDFLYHRVEFGGARTLHVAYREKIPCVFLCPSCFRTTKFVNVISPYCGELAKKLRAQLTTQTASLYYAVH